MTEVLVEYEVTDYIGIRTVVLGGVRRDGDDDTIEIPKLEELMAAAAIARCLVPIRLRGSEIRAMRKIIGWTLAQLAKKLDEKTATETVSRWETETQPMGGYAEKLFRLLVCENLKDRAPGVAYSGSKIADLKVYDPWMSDPEFEIPAVRFSMERLFQSEGPIQCAWYGHASAA